MITYKLRNNTTTNKLDSVVKKIDNIEVLSISICNGNTDYQEYLKWVEDGGVPEEADEKLSKILVKTKKKLKKAK